jgi:uncharacterized membrane protein
MCSCIVVKKDKMQRFWEIDTLRGIAILMMIVYHVLFDLTYFGFTSTDLNALPVLIFLYPIGTLFLLLVGVSLTLSYNRVKQALDKNQLRIKYLQRGSSIFGLGLIITLVTWVYPHNGYIIFGVLHCIGLSILFGYFFIQSRLSALLIGMLCVIIGVFLRVNVTVDFPWLLWLGFVPSSFYTLDYFPLLPWFGVVLIGIFLGNSLYQNNTRVFSIKDHSTFIGTRLLCFLGRHSLIIYLLHQLVIVGFLYVLASG